MKKVCSSPPEQRKSLPDERDSVDEVKCVSFLRIKEGNPYTGCSVHLTCAASSSSVTFIHKFT